MVERLQFPGPPLVGSIGCAVMIVAMAAVLLFLASWQRQGVTVLVPVVVAALFCYWLWRVYIRCRVLVREDTISIVNPVFTYVVAWSEIAAISSRRMVTLSLADDREIEIFALHGSNWPGLLGRQSSRDRAAAHLQTMAATHGDTGSPPALEALSPAQRRAFQKYLWAAVAATIVIEILFQRL